MNMELKIPPALVMAFFGGAMWAFDTYLFSGFDVIPVSYWISRFFLLMAVILGVLGLIQFYWNSTSIDPHKPEKAGNLVTGGIYRLSRNPMYVALLFLLIGFGFRLQNLPSLLLVPLFIWYMNRFQIKPEEEVLMEKFGEEYRKYTSRVRRWL